MGQVLKTLIHKYGFHRQQFFVSTKLGFSSYDEEDDIPRLVQILEVIAGSNLKEQDFLH